MSKRVWLWGGVVIAGLILIGLWLLATRSSDSDATTTSPVRNVRPVRHAARFSTTSTESSTSWEGRPGETTSITNAADIYREAFAQFDALSKADKEILRDWQTNIDAAVAEELCEKIGPICDLMLQATTITNCDWGFGLMTFETRLVHLAPARALARAGVWSATHCRSNAVTAATDDLVSVVQLGRQVDSCAMIGSLVEMAIESIATACVASNLGWFAGIEGKRLIDRFTDPSVDELPGRAMQMEADLVERFAAKLAAMPAAEAEQGLLKFATGFGDEEPLKVDRATGLAVLKQIVDSERELAAALASSSNDQYEAWRRHFAELLASGKVAQALLPACEPYVGKVQRVAVNRAMVVTALAVAANGTDGLTAYPDPTTGEPFTYREVPGGFELQSSYQVTNQPLKMVFSLQTP